MTTTIASPTAAKKQTAWRASLVSLLLLAAGGSGVQQLAGVAVRARNEQRARLGVSVAGAAWYRQLVLVVRFVLDGSFVATTATTTTATATTVGNGCL